MIMKSERILCAGMLCLDVVTVCSSFPKEDTDQRCLDLQWQVGGNASNNAVVLAHLGQPSELVAVMANDDISTFLKSKLMGAGVEVSRCPIINGATSPTSTVVVNDVNGSRTILHHRRKDFPELSLQTFKEIELSLYKWILFEGRNLNVLPEIISYIRKTRPEVKISVEVEKPKEKIESLLPLGDITFVSKDYARAQGFKNKEDAVKEIEKLVKPGSILVCPWGDEGAAAIANGELFSVPASPPVRLVDTLGAGDTFLASTILAISKNHNVKKSIEFGCRVAGLKCGIPGKEGIKDAKEELLRFLDC